MVPQPVIAISGIWGLFVLFWCSESWALTLIFVFSSAKCGLQTYYEDKMPPLGAFYELHWGQVIDIVVCPGSFFFQCLFFSFFLIITLSFIFLSCKPTTATATSHEQATLGPNNDRCLGKFFFVSFLFLSFFN